MIIWRGWGVGVIGIVFACGLMANLMANVLGSGGYWDSHGWPLACALFLSAIIIWIADVMFTRQAERVLVDENTGEHVAVRTMHDFFFLRIRWWGVICACIAILILVTHFAPGTL